MEEDIDQVLLGITKKSVKQDKSNAKYNLTSTNNVLDLESESDDCCTSVSQRPVNPLSVLGTPVSNSLPLPAVKMVTYDRFWQGQAENLANDNKDDYTELSSSVGTFSVEPKKRHPVIFSEWCPILRNRKLQITGVTIDGNVDSRSIDRRISGYIFYDKTEVPCSLGGPMTVLNSQPKFIQHKFALGIPEDWVQVQSIWNSFEKLGSPENFPWLSSTDLDTSDPSITGYDQSVIPSTKMAVSTPRNNTTDFYNMTTDISKINASGGQRTHQQKLFHNTVNSSASRSMKKTYTSAALKKKMNRIQSMLKVTLMRECSKLKSFNEVVELPENRLNMRTCNAEVSVDNGVRQLKTITSDSNNEYLFQNKLPDQLVIKNLSTINVNMPTTSQSTIIELAEPANSLHNKLTINNINADSLKTTTNVFLNKSQFLSKNKSCNDVKNISSSSKNSGKTKLHVAETNNTIIANVSQKFQEYVSQKDNLPSEMSELSVSVNQSSKTNSSEKKLVKNSTGFNVSVNNSKKGTPPTSSTDDLRNYVPSNITRNHRNSLTLLMNKIGIEHKPASDNSSEMDNLDFYPTKLDSVVISYHTSNQIDVPIDDVNTEDTTKNNSFVVENVCRSLKNSITDDIHNDKVVQSEEHQLESSCDDNIFSSKSKKSGNTNKGKFNASIQERPLNKDNPYLNHTAKEISNQNSNKINEEVPANIDISQHDKNQNNNVRNQKVFRNKILFSSESSDDDDNQNTNQINKAANNSKKGTPPTWSTDDLRNYVPSNITRNHRNSLTLLLNKIGIEHKPASDNSSEMDKLDFYPTKSDSVVISYHTSNQIDVPIDDVNTEHTTKNNSFVVENVCRSLKNSIRDDIHNDKVVQSEEHQLESSCDDNIFSSKSKKAGNTNKGKFNASIQERPLNKDNPYLNHTAKEISNQNSNKINKEVPANIDISQRDKNQNNNVRNQKVFRNIILFSSESSDDDDNQNTNQINKAANTNVEVSNSDKHLTTKSIEEKINTSNSESSDDGGVKSILVNEIIVQSSNSKSKLGAESSDNSETQESHETFVTSAVVHSTVKASVKSDQVSPTLQEHQHSNINKSDTRMNRRAIIEKINDNLEIISSVKVLTDGKSVNRSNNKIKSSANRTRDNSSLKRKDNNNKGKKSHGEDKATNQNIMQEDSRIQFTEETIQEQNLPDPKQTPNSSKIRNNTKREKDSIQNEKSISTNLTLEFDLDLNNTTFSRRGRARCQTLPFWTGARFVTIGDETIVTRVSALKSSNKAVENKKRFLTPQKQTTVAKKARTRTPQKSPVKVLNTELTLLSPATSTGPEQQNYNIANVRTRTPKNTKNVRSASSRNRSQNVYNKINEKSVTEVLTSDICTSPIMNERLLTPQNQTSGAQGARTETPQKSPAKVHKTELLVLSTASSAKTAQQNKHIAKNIKNLRSTAKNKRDNLMDSVPRYPIRNSRSLSHSERKDNKINENSVTEIEIRTSPISTNKKRRGNKDPVELPRSVSKKNIKKLLHEKNDSGKCSPKSKDAKKSVTTKKCPSELLKSPQFKSPKKLTETNNRETHEMVVPKLSQKKSRKTREITPNKRQLRSNSVSLPSTKQNSVEQSIVINSTIDKRKTLLKNNEKNSSSELAISKAPVKKSKKLKQNTTEDKNLTWNNANCVSSLPDRSKRSKKYNMTDCGIDYDFSESNSQKTEKQKTNATQTVDQHYDRYINNKCITLVTPLSAEEIEKYTKNKSSEPVVQSTMSDQGSKSVNQTINRKTARTAEKNVASSSKAKSQSRQKKPRKQKSFGETYFGDPVKMSLMVKLKRKRKPKEKQSINTTDLAAISSIESINSTNNVTRKGGKRKLYNETDWLNSKECQQMFAEITKPRRPQNFCVEVEENNVEHDYFDDDIISEVSAFGKV